MNTATDTTVEIDFDGAALFLQKAREAMATGDIKQFVACRKLVAVALGMFDGPVPRMQTAHLKESEVVGACAE